MVALASAGSKASIYLSFIYFFNSLFIELNIVADVKSNAIRSGTSMEMIKNKYVCERQMKRSAN